MNAAVIVALALVISGALYVHLRWRRSPRAYRAMIGLSIGYFIAGALVGALVLHLVAAQHIPSPDVTGPSAGAISPGTIGSPAGGVAIPPIPAVGHGSADAVPPDVGIDDLELLRHFCVYNRDASVRVADFLTARTEIGVFLRSYPEESPDGSPDPSDGMHHMHRSTLVDFCKAMHGGVYDPFCVAIQSDPKTESLTPREYFKLQEQLTNVIRKRVGLEPNSFSTIPGTNYDPRVTLADMCRGAGL